MAAGIEIGHCAVREEMQSLCLLGYLLQTKVNKLQQKMSSQLLEWYAVQCNNCLHSIMIRDKSWFHHFDSKQNDRVWNGFTQHYPSKRSQKQCP